MVVPQSSILGLLPFLIHINDLPGACEFFDSVLFADDTILVYPKNQEEKLLLKNILEKFTEKLFVNKLALNIDKTQAITFLKIRTKRFIYQIPSLSEVVV